MEPHDDRIAKRLAEIQAQEQELDRESAQRSTPEPDPGSPVATRRDGGTLRSAAFLAGVILLTAALIGTAVTLNRMAGRDIADAKRLGQAAVTSCTRHGPITNHGFGYWQRCTATITWDNGQVTRTTADAVFTPNDIGTKVSVGDLGNYRTSKQLARADTDRRPWLAWIGYTAGALALVPGIAAVLLLRELLRFRRRSARSAGSLS